MKGLLLLFLLSLHSLSVVQNFIINRRSSAYVYESTSAYESVLRDLPDKFTVPTSLCSKSGTDCARMGGKRFESHNCTCMCDEIENTGTRFKSIFGFYNGNWSCTKNAVVRQQSGCSYYFNGKTSTKELFTLPLDISHTDEFDPNIYISGLPNGAKDCKILARKSKYLKCDGTWKRLRAAFLKKEFDIYRKNKVLKVWFRRQAYPSVLSGKIVKLAVKCGKRQRWNQSQCVVLKIAGEMNCSSFLPTSPPASRGTTIIPTSVKSETSVPTLAMASTRLKSAAEFVTEPTLTSQLTLRSKFTRTTPLLTKPEQTPTSAGLLEQTPRSTSIPPTLRSKPNQTTVVVEARTMLKTALFSEPTLKSTSIHSRQFAEPALLVIKTYQESVDTSTTPTTIKTFAQRNARRDRYPSADHSVVLAGASGAAALLVGVILIVVVLTLMRRRKISHNSDANRPNIGDREHSITIRNPQTVSEEEHPYDMVTDDTRATQRTGHNPVTDGSTGQDPNEGPLYGVIDDLPNHVYRGLEGPYSEGNSMNGGLEGPPTCDDATKASVYDVLEEPDPGETPEYNVLEEPDIDVYRILEETDSEGDPVYRVLEASYSEGVQSHGVQNKANRNSDLNINSTSYNQDCSDPMYDSCQIPCEGINDDHEYQELNHEGRCDNEYQALSPETKYDSAYA